MKKLILLFALLLGLTTSANALMFDPTGTGNIATSVEITTWDWAPSSAVAIGANGADVGDTFTLLTHGVLGIGYDSSSTASYTTIGSGVEITFVAGFTEQVTDSTYNAVNNTSSQDFGIVGGAPNFFEVYIDASPDADLDLAGGTAGTGFNGTSGELLFKGTIFGGSGSFSSDFNDIRVLDSYGTDEASGNGDADSTNDPFANDGTQLTVYGTGGTTIYSEVAFSDFNTLYFPEIDPTALLWLIFSTNTNNNIPFAQVDPANRYWDGTTTYTPTVGVVNGLPGNGPDVIFQMDASTSEVGVVPEPGTLMLLGFGLLGFAGIARRKKA